MEGEMDNTFDENNNGNNNGNNNNEDKTINAENLNIDTTLNEISHELKPGETLVLDIGNNYFHQTDEIYDTLVMRGYEVRKSFRNGRNQIIVNKKA
jgi:hypothetical protein